MLHQTQRTSVLAAEKKFRESMKSIGFWSQVLMTIDKYIYLTHHYTENSNNTDQCLLQ
ncbi:hypothetical protein IMY05_003G0093300 [Salix suchowensis]|nr:hypothetical protein IMY05_003G0093300 [Salix suchowensis]